MAMSKMSLEGPIPGENFTSDTRNYPWHRPPDFTDIDDALEAATKQMTAKDAVLGLVTMLETGMTVAQAATVYVIAGMGSGKWTPDFAVLLVGPVARIIKLIAEGYGIKYEMGIEDKTPRKTKAYFKALDEINLDEEKAEEVGEEIATVLGGEADNSTIEATGGFMSMPEGM